MLLAWWPTPRATTITPTWTLAPPTESTERRVSSTSRTTTAEATWPASLWTRCTARSSNSSSISHLSSAEAPTRSSPPPRRTEAGATFKSCLRSVGENTHLFCTSSGHSISVWEFFPLLHKRIEKRGTLQQLPRPVSQFSPLLSWLLFTRISWEFRFFLIRCGKKSELGCNQIKEGQGFFTFGSFRRTQVDEKSQGCNLAKQLVEKGGRKTKRSSSHFLSLRKNRKVIWIQFPLLPLFFLLLFRKSIVFHQGEKKLSC